MPAYVYIDLDGTLTDPFEGISNCIAHALGKLGQERPADAELRRFIGPPLLETFEELVGTEVAPRALGYYRERFTEIGWRENALYPGICVAMEALTSAGHRCFVATSKPRVFAQRIVEHFGLSSYFDDVYGSELDGTRTDKTELLRFAARQRTEGWRPVMIGDRYHDIVGALNNGFRAIGVTWGFGTDDELRGAGAHYLATAPEQLPCLVSIRN